jgi:hypothetical protein
VTQITRTSCSGRQGPGPGRSRCCCGRPLQGLRSDRAGTHSLRRGRYVQADSRCSGGMPRLMCINARSGQRPQHPGRLPDGNLLPCSASTQDARVSRTRPPVRPSMSHVSEARSRRRFTVRSRPASDSCPDRYELLLCARVESAIGAHQLCYSPSAGGADGGRLALARRTGA